jgi:hypothetical protein
MFKAFDFGFAGRLARNVLQTGKVLLNGKKRRLDFGAVVSYLHRNQIYHAFFFTHLLNLFLMPTK